MIQIYKFISKLINGLINVLFVIQITLMILVFLTATYWFFNLIGITVFDFVQPIANVVSDFVKIFYNQSVSVGGVYIDGSLFLFYFLAFILLLFTIHQTNWIVSILIDSILIRKYVIICLDCSMFCFAYFCLFSVHHHHHYYYISILTNHRINHVPSV